MRYTRGLFQSLGASGSLLAAAACALLTLSAAVGYRGWPGLHPDQGAPAELLVAAQPSAKPRRQRAGRPSGAFVAPPATAPGRTVAAAHVPQAARRAAGGTLSARAEAPASAPATAPAAGAAAPAAAPASQSPAAPVTHRVAQGVRETGHGAAGAVAPVSPTAAQTVTTATDTAAGVVDKAGGLLAP